MANFSKKAVALSYHEQKDHAPRVKAKGSGEIAEKILSAAKTHDIPVHNDSNLVQLLGELDINEEIPEDLYRVVAEVFAFIYALDQEL